jgi:hypothetical protein
VNRFFAFLAYPEAAVAKAAESSTRISQLFGPAVDVAHRQVAFGRALDFVQLVRALLNRDSIAMPNAALQFRDAGL